MKDCPWLLVMIIVGIIVFFAGVIKQGLLIGILIALGTCFVVLALFFFLIAAILYGLRRL